MSGGSWNYIYRQFEETAEQLKRSDRPERVALGELVERVALAMHQIEWVDSGDRNKGEELAAIQIAIGHQAPVDRAAIRRAREAAQRFLESTTDA